MTDLHSQLRAYGRQIETELMSPVSHAEESPLVELKPEPRQPGRRAFAFVVALLILVVALPFVLARGNPPAATTTPTPSTTATPSTTVSPNASPTDTTTWATFQSDRYGFSIGYPPDWTVTPADHDWTLEGDADNWLSTGQEVFYPPSHDVRVSVWSVPLEPGKTLETPADVEAWIEQYCQLSSPTCTGFNDLAVPLCLEKRDCHPGLLVPFDEDVQAFFPGSGAAGWDRMVVVAIWRVDSDLAVAPYGGARPLLEAFLSTMDVYPARPDQIP